MVPHLAVCDGCNIDAGDRLISVNDVTLDGLSHASTIDILQNAPDDVLLVVSQPKERLYKGKLDHYCFNFYGFLIFVQD